MAGGAMRSKQITSLDRANQVLSIVALLRVCTLFPSHACAEKCEQDEGNSYYQKEIVLETVFHGRAPLPPLWSNGFKWAAVTPVTRGQHYRASTAAPRTPSCLSA